MAVKTVIIPIAADISGLQVGIDAIEALGGVDEATAKKFAQSNKIFQEQNKIISASGPEIAKLTAAITALTESIVGGALTQKLTQIGTATEKSGALASAAAPKINKVTESLTELATTGDLSQLNTGLENTSEVLGSVAESANNVHASFDDFANDAQKIDFTSLSVEQLEKTLDDLIKKEGLLKSAQQSTLDPELIARYQAGLQSVTSDINEVSQLLDQANENKLFPPEPVGKFSEEIKKLKAQLTGLNSGTPEFDKVSNDLKAADIAAAGFTKTATSLRAQLRQYREVLAQLEEAGLENTSTFQKMAIAAGQLDDQMGDTQARIRALASDTFAFDAAIQGAQGVTAAFSIAQGASALFGSENEDLQKALLKVNAATAVLTGLQQIQNTLQSQTAIVTAVALAQQKLATLQTVIQTGVESKNIIVRYAAIVAQKALNLVMSQNPAGLLLIAIGALAGGLLYLTSSTDAAAEAQKKMNQELETFTKISERSAIVANQSGALRLAQLQKDRASIEEIRSTETQNLRDQVGIAKNLYDKATQDVATYGNDIKKLSKEQLEQYLQARQTQQDAGQKYFELENQLAIKRLQNQKNAEDESLRSASASAQARIAQTVKDSNARTVAEISAIRIRQQQQLAAENLTAGEREQIVADNEASIRALRREAQERSLEDQIALLKASSLEERNTYKKLELDIQVIQLQSERDRLGKSKAQQELIITQTNEAIKELRKKLYADLTAIDNLHSTQTLAQQQKDFQDNLKREKDLFDFKVQLGQEQRDATTKALLEEKAFRQKIQQDTLSAASNIAGSTVEISKNLADAQIAILDEQLKKGLISQQSYDQQTRAIKRKAAVQEKQLALFQATISQSLAVLSVLRDQTIPVLFKPAIIALTVAQAVAQIAAIASRPIPAFAKGTKNAPGGDSLVGEAGPELIYQSGQWGYAASPTVLNLKKGAKVIPALETAKILEKYNIPKPYLEQTVTTTMNGQKIDYSKLGRVIGKEIGKLPLTVSNIGPRGIEQYQTTIANQAAFINNRYRSNR